jgi:hypothetical protein
MTLTEEQWQRLLRMVRNDYGWSEQELVRVLTTGAVQWRAGTGAPLHQCEGFSRGGPAVYDGDGAVYAGPDPTR